MTTQRWLASFVLASMAVLIFCGPAHAQLKEDLEFNFFVAGSAYTKNSYETSFPQSITPIQGQFKLNDSIRGGLRLNVYTRGHWGEEFLYSFEPNTAHFIRRTPPTSSTNLKIQVHNVAANALYYFQEDESHYVRPFLTVGLGATVYRLTPEATAFARDPLRGNLADMDQSRELALNYGVGFKAKFGRFVGFRMDVRHFLGRNPSFGLARSSNNPNATVFPATGAIHNLEASAGLIFYAGKPQ